MKAKSGSYPEQDADSAGHANLAHAHHRHFVPGRLRGTTKQRADELLQDRGHFKCCGRSKRGEGEGGGGENMLLVRENVGSDVTDGVNRRSSASKNRPAYSNFINTACRTERLTQVALHTCRRIIIQA